MIKKYIYILLFVLFSTHALASNPVLDSLKNELNSTINDTSRVKIYNRIAEIYTKSKPDSAFTYVVKAFDLTDILLKTENTKEILSAKQKVRICSTAASFTLKTAL